MKQHARLWILLWITIVAITTSALSDPSESGVVEAVPSSLSQNNTATRSTKKTKKAPKKASKKTSKSPAETSEEVVSSALKSFKPLQKLKIDKITRFLRENKVQLTIILAVALFRKEILRLAWRLLSKPVTNPQTGETRRVLSVHPMRIGQFLFLLVLARRLQQSNGTEGSNVSPLLAAAFAGGRVFSPVAALFLSKFLSPGSSIYLPPTKQHFTFETINDRYSKDLFAYEKAVRVNNLRSLSSANVTDANPAIVKQALVEDQCFYSEAIVVIDWTNLDSSVSRMDVMRDEVSFILRNYETQGDVDFMPRFQEVVLLLESQGGSAADYSLASQQILRLRKKGIKVTICVDKVAASGGYMIACASSPGCLLAAPFAILGSIGVIGQTINIQKTLEGWGIRPLVFKGGKDKAPVGLIGDVTRDGMAKLQQLIDKTHVAFKQHVSACRPSIASDIEAIATGDIWFGQDALSLGLVDRITTSDEYIGERISEGALALKLVQLVKGRYPFQRPTTTSEIAHNDHPLGRKSAHASQDLDAIINGIRRGLSLLQSSEDETFAWAKHLGTDVRMKESLSSNF